MSSETKPQLKLIPPAPTRMEALSSSHFSIGNDQRLSKSALKGSTFMLDYGKVPPSSSKASLIKPPPPAQLMHRNLKATTEELSETRVAYRDKGYAKADSCSVSTHTNFKMDADDRVKTFETMNSLVYTKQPMSRSKAKEDPMKSSIPQGDLEKEKIPSSDYKAMFTGHDTRVVKVEKVGRKEEDSDRTIKGDPQLQLHQFITSNDGHYPYKFEKPERIYYKTQPDKTLTISSSIPVGDQEKLKYPESTQKFSFPPIKDLNSYRITGASLGTGRATNLKLGHSKEYDTYSSTIQSSYLPVIGEKSKAKRINMAISSFPEGDLNPERVRQRTSVTTHRLYHSMPPKDFRNPIISGADKRTLSQVVFGEPHLSSRYYNTTGQDEFHSYPSIKLPKISNKLYRSSIPLDYFGGEVHLPTTRTDFPAYNVAKPLQLTGQKAHIKQPLGEERFFNTTHLTSYTPQTQGYRYSYDKGKLQKSSIPLGTFSL